MVADGIYYGVALAGGGALLGWLKGPLWAAPLWLVAAFCLYFFRDPEREVPLGDVAVSPADGKVVAVRALEASQARISIFMNVFDVHVNRAPIGGRIAAVEYRKGRFLAANGERASQENEQNTVRIEAGGTQVTFKQIAGLIARRIVFYKRAGELVRCGERVGLIKFGSRVDVFLGPEWDVQVRPGERVRAGSSVLARRRGE